MANPKLTVEIGADLTELGSGINKAASTVEKGAKQMTAATGQVDKSFDKLSKDVSNSMSNVSSSTSKASNDVSKSLAKVAQQTNAMGGGLSKGANEASVALTNFGRIAQDLPYGMMGISNNLNPMIESFGRLRKETGSTGGALKAMASGLTGAGGLGIAVSAISAAMSFAAVGMTFWKSRTAEAKDTAIGAAGAFGILNKSLEGSDYSKAISSVNELKINIGLAKEGFLNKDDVLKTYNKTLGKTIGEVDNLDAAEKNIVKNGDAFIRMTLLKASAQLALEESAKAAFEAEKTRQKGLLGITRDGNGAQENLTILERLNSAFSQSSKITDSLIKKATEREAKAATDSANSLLNIAEKFQKEAAQIAEKNGFKFFDDKSLKEERDKIAEIYKTLVAELKSNPLEFGATKIDIAENNIKSYQKAIDGLIKNGFEPASKAVQDLIDKQEKIAKGFITPNLGPASSGVSAANTFTPITQLKDIKFKLPVGLTEYEKLIKSAEESNDRFIQSLNEVGKAALSSGIGDAFNSIGEALATGGNFIDAAGNAILSVMANFLNQLGQMFIKEGIAQIAFGVAQNLILPGSGANRVAGGVGMIAAGGLISIAGGAAGARGKGKSAKDPVKPIRAFATGGYNLPSGMALVGERGPEIVNLPTGSDVYNNNKTMGMLSRANNDSIVLQGDLGISLETLYFRLKKVEQNINR